MLDQPVFSARGVKRFEILADLQSIQMRAENALKMLQSLRAYPGANYGSEERKRFLQEK